MERAMSQEGSRASKDEKRMGDQELMQTILQEIDALLKSGVLPVSLDHLKHLSQDADILECLMAMKKEGLISGDLITMSTSGTPHRMTNIRLTYLGIKSLRQ
ncbi:MAG TPA: hypothetical protein VID27_18645 [Blastocatellia bacterium]|jgi:hypothetical protein